MYLVKRRALKQHHGSAIDGELPALGKLERMMTHPFNAGFPVLTLGTILAVAYGSELGENWLTSSKIILGLAVWLVYGCLFILHRADKLLPRRLAQGIIFLFILCCFYYLFTIPKADQANRHKVEVEQAK